MDKLIQSGESWGKVGQGGKNRGPIISDHFRRFPMLSERFRMITGMKKQKNKCKKNLKFILFSCGNKKTKKNAPMLFLYCGEHGVLPHRRQKMQQLPSYFRSRLPLLQG